MQGVKEEGRPVTYMALPTCIKDKHGDDGSELCIQLSTPCWGEREAGFEWQKAFEKTLLEAGWTPAEGVPCLWYFVKANGTDCRITIIVDDVLCSETAGSNYSICEALASLLTKRYGDCKQEREPTSFKGSSIKRDRPARQLQLTFPQKIIEAAREHLPALLQPGEKLKLLKGAEFRATINDMKTVEPRPAKLDGTQVNNQRLISSLKYIAILHPRLSLALHRLSCVMSAPPHVA